MVNNAQFFQERGVHAGARFQNAIDITLAAYEQQGRAVITRKAVPGKFLGGASQASRGLALSTSVAALNPSFANMGGKGRPTFVPEAKAEPDYGGVVAPTGRAIFFDAKSTKRTQLDFDNLHSHQVEFLRRAMQAGALAGFLVEFSAVGEVYALPIAILLEYAAVTARKSLPRSFFAEVLGQVQQGQGLLVCDFLASFAQLEERYGPGCRLFTWTGGAHHHKARSSAKPK